MAKVTTRISRLIRPEVAALIPYATPQSLEDFAATHGVSPEQVAKLDQNENPYGCSPRVLEALGRFRWYHVYPDPDHAALRQGVADYAGANVSSVVIGNGSDELIELLFRVLVEPGDRVLGASPTFSYYDTVAQAAGAEYVAIPRGPAFEVDPDAIAAAITPRTKLVLLASPNNPTGNLTPIDVIRRLARLDVVVVVDEAYFEFCGQTALPLLTSGEADNVVVLRTFSKWAGLAGLRLGYGVLTEDLVRAIRSVQPPYSIGQAAEVAGLASLDDVVYLKSTVARIVAERERLRGDLAKIGYLRVYPSDANFLLCELIGKSAVEVQKGLADRAILVRRYSAPRLENCLRISVGRPEHSDRLLAALREMA